jgi:hypothetical protein
MKRPFALGLLLLSCSLSPLFAGEVFVPYASNRTIGGTTYRTKVWVTNTGSAARRFITLFIQSGTDGSKLPDPDPATGIALAGGTTMVLTNTAPAGQVGMLEISGAPQLVITARVEALDGSGNLQSSANLPIVSLANSAASNTSVDLQGLERTGSGKITDFTLLNLSRQAAKCTLTPSRADGTRITQPVVFTLLPLSHQTFSDVLTELGQSLIADTHFQVSCDHPFYTYALAYRIGGPETDFIGPSTALVGDLVAGGGGTGGTGDGGGTGNVVFDVPGTFLVARNNASYISYNLPAKDGVHYQRAVIEYDMHITQFDPVLLFTGVTSFRRPNTVRGLRVVYYAIQIVNQNAKTTLDLGVEDVLVKTKGPWQANGTYHVRITYDIPSQTVMLETLKNGLVTYTISGPAQHLDLSAIGTDHPLQVDFGQTGIADGAYIPPYGWSFSNLHTVLTPQ